MKKYAFPTFLFASAAIRNRKQWQQILKKSHFVAYIHSNSPYHSFKNAYLFNKREQPGVNEEKEHSAFLWEPRSSWCLLLRRPPGVE